MNSKKQPVRMGRYTNLGHVKAATKKRKSHKKNWFAWFWRLDRKKKLMVLATPVLIFLIATPLVTYAIYARDISDQERLMNRNNTGIVLTDVNGEKFYSIGRAEHRTLIPLEGISVYTKEALIATEDKDFYKHGGFSIGSILRAVMTNVSQGSASAYGGSTLTQQLAKNTLLSDEKNYLRKYQELAVSVAIEQNYSKDEILAMYLNSVYYGENAFGIEDAAKAYFNKSPKDLDLAESSMLIGILPAPSAYSPISGSPEYAKQRQTTVLKRMVTNGYITEAEKTAALSQDLAYGAGAEAQQSIAPHFAEMVLNELSEKYGYEKVMRSGFQVTTTLDIKAQTALNESVDRAIGHINGNGGTNASGIIIDPKTGEVRGLVGSADYNNEDWGKVNMVTTERQPGSSFKPIYYAHALADGVITPSTILKDEKTDFGGGYIPFNADRKFRGDVSVRQSLNWSLNIPSIQVMQKYGISKTVDGANELGIEIDKSKDRDLTLALGSVEVPLEQMTNAYAAFANQGQQHKTTIIKQVNDKYGKKIQSTSATQKQVISKEGAYLISNILSDNTTRSAVFGSSLTVSGHTAAVKTGTTNDNRDAWTIGYTPSYAMGVWVGNNDNTAMLSGGSDMAGPIWRNTMQKILSGTPDEKFVVPSGIVQRLTCVSNGGLAASEGTGTYNEYYMAGALPTETCDPTPVMITVCNLDSEKIESIEEKKFDGTRYSKSLEACEAKKIQVCDIAAGKIITIDEDEYDSTKYSKDTTNCSKQSQSPKQIQVCDYSNPLKPKLVTINEDDYDPATQTKDTTNCGTSPTYPPQQ